MFACCFKSDKNVTGKRNNLEAVNWTTAALQVMKKFVTLPTRFLSNCDLKSNSVQAEATKENEQSDSSKVAKFSFVQISCAKPP